MHNEFSGHVWYMHYRESSHTAIVVTSMSLEEDFFPLHHLGDLFQDLGHYNILTLCEDHVC